MNIDEKYLFRCIELGKIGLGTTAPNPMVGSVIVYNDKIIGEGYTSPFGGPHAEVNAINSVKHKELLAKATLYVTLEPCAMCFGAMMHARIERIIFGAYDPKTGVCGSCDDLTNANYFKHRIDITGGILEQECKQILQSFFKLRR